MTPTGLLGGSFNPAHRGHRSISLFAIDALALDELWWLVSPGNPLKNAGDMAPLAARHASARAMARRAPIRATAIEARLGTRYTIDTLRALIRRYPKRRFIWLMGNDNLAQFHRWRDWRKIAAMVPIAVIARPGYEGAAARLPRWDGCGASSTPSATSKPGRTGDRRRSCCCAFAPIRVRRRCCGAPIPAGTTAIPPVRRALRALPDLGTSLPASSLSPRPADPAAVAALHALVLQSLDDDQAVDTISIPLEGKSSIADHMVIASGRSTRQVASMAHKLADKIKTELGRSSRIEGLPAADWVLIDAGDVIVHLFRPEVRSFYNLERMWAFGEAPDAEPRAGAA